jgi:hypothetical protein
MAKANSIYRFFEQLQGSLKPTSGYRLFAPVKANVKFFHGLGQVLVNQGIINQRNIFYGAVTEKDIDLFVVGII